MKYVLWPVFSLMVLVATTANCQDSGLQIGILPSDTEDKSDWVVQVVERGIISGEERFILVENADVVVMQGNVERYRRQTNALGRVEFHNLEPRNGEVTVYVKRQNAKTWERTYRPAWRMPSRRVELAASRPLESGWKAVSETSYYPQTTAPYCVSYQPMQTPRYGVCVSACPTEVVQYCQPLMSCAPVECW